MMKGRMFNSQRYNLLCPGMAGNRPMFFYNYLAFVVSTAAGRLVTKFIDERLLVA